MADNQYQHGIGMFGDVKGSYGRYAVGPQVNNLSQQFNNIESVEEKQRRRFKRKRESGFVGNGYSLWNYPYMIGAVGAGTIIQTHDDPDKDADDMKDQTQQATGDTGTAPITSGMAEGGTAGGADVTGASGGGMP